MTGRPGRAKIGRAAVRAGGAPSAAAQGRNDGRVLGIACAGGRRADGLGPPDVPARRAARRRRRHVRPAGRAGARIVVWGAAAAGGGARPIGTVAVLWRAPGAGEATLAELSWPPTPGEAELWRAVEELAGHPIPR
jgi:hypothetical protein